MPIKTKLSGLLLMAWAKSKDEASPIREEKPIGKARVLGTRSCRFDSCFLDQETYIPTRPQSSVMALPWLDGGCMQRLSEQCT